ncbi:putative RNA-binding protein [Trypanosoma grayi]|uniref:putative RNA-binding protein n=1 Tax=Trypanosoma grayi TaxID=71804 RepID=UPI0004F41EE1|nr:putative RNA-binding protein [Trypanosoma grayi]KEG11058.1 putative RNA-binding protein [Trypanosoma grayi]
MPSRAVLRKKARRDAKRSKRETEAAATFAVATPSPSDEQKQQQQQLLSERRREGIRPAKATSRKRPFAAVEENTVETPESAEGMSRKERKRSEARRRLERQLVKLNASLANETDNTTAAADDNKDNGGQDGEGDVAPSLHNRALRHDPKFKNGTFWRTRKEQRARTLFLGNMPARFTLQNVMDFVSSVVDADPVLGDETGDDAAEAVVESVDFLPTKPRAKHRHMFLTLRSKEAAAHVTNLLDAYRLEGTVLRCNFAADKQQRSEAIQRRSGKTGDGS